MPIVIQEVTVEMESSSPSSLSSEPAWVGDEHLRELMNEMQIAEERQKRLTCD